jgi:hypothetical protein
VTALYVPHQAVERIDRRVEMVAVRTVPLGDGALVLLAESNQDFDAVESAWHLAFSGPAKLAAGGR